VNSARPMDETTLTALQGSIKKWEAIVAGTGGDAGVENCPLCAAFADAEDEDPEGWLECYGCPVAHTVGQTSCGGTPYVQWANGVRAHEKTAAYPWKATTPELVALAQAELDFLTSLLPVPA